VLSFGQLVYQDVPDAFLLSLPAPLWIGPVNSDPALYPERAMHVNGRIELAGGQSLLQLRPWLQCGLVAECAGGKPADHGAGLDLVRLISAGVSAALR